MRHKAVRFSALVLLAFTGINFCYSIEAIEKPLSYAGQNAIAYAQDYVGEKKYEDAMKQAEAAIRSDPKSGVPYMVKGFIYDLQNDTQKASKAFSKAIALSPQNGYVLTAYAKHLCSKLQFQQADAAFLKATQDSLYPLSSKALEGAAQCAMTKEDFDLAEVRARAALALSPESAVALETMAQVKFKQSNSFEARAFMQRREALGPLNVPMLQLANQIEKSAGDDRAAAQYQKQLDILLQAQIQPPTGEGQKKP